MTQRKNNYLVGAGLAEPDGVWVVPFDFVMEPTDNLAGLAGVEVITRLVGILVGVPSSVWMRFCRREGKKFWKIRWCWRRWWLMIGGWKVDECIGG